MSDDAGAAIQKELGAAVHFAKCNVTDEVSVKAALAAGLARFGGKLHGVVNSGASPVCVSSPIFCCDVSSQACRTDLSITSRSLASRRRSAEEGARQDRSAGLGLVQVRHGRECHWHLQRAAPRRRNHVKAGARDWRARCDYQCRIGASIAPSLIIMDGI